MEKGYDAFLIVNIGFPANEWSLHLVDGLLEELFVLSNEQFLDILKTAFTLRD